MDGYYGQEDHPQVQAGCLFRVRQVAMSRQPDLSDPAVRLAEAKGMAAAARKARLTAEKGMRAGDPALVRAAAQAAEMFTRSAVQLLQGAKLGSSRVPASREEALRELDELKKQTRVAGKKTA